MVGDISVGDMSVGRQEAFEIFRRDYEHNDAIEDNKRQLKDRYAEAKTRGEIVNKSRNKISKFKFSCLFLFSSYVLQIFLAVIEQ